MDFFKLMFKKKSLIFSLCFSSAALVLTVLIQVLCSVVNVDFMTESILLIIGLVFLLIGWVGGNRISYGYRKEKAMYSGPLPDDVKIKVYEFRAKFILTALIILLYSVIYDLFLLNLLIF